MEALKFEDLTKDAEQYLRNVSVDNVIFGYHDKELKVLLQQPFTSSKWTVTGGYIKRTETIEQAANRIALTRTGLDNLYFQQFGAFGSPDRANDSDFNGKRLSELLGTKVPNDFFAFDYFVSVGFYTLTEFSLVATKKDEHEVDCRWWPVNELPVMMFDHQHIINEALRALRLHIAHYPIGYELLPQKFTLPEIHNLYETILGKPLDDRNFAKRLMATGIIIKLKETKKIGAHRSPFLYKFDKEKYDEGLKSGVTLAF
ncbi:8-oxo-dGTP diphosphatase [Mucilaginibacter sp. UYNi724]